MSTPTPPRTVESSAATIGGQPSSDFDRVGLRPGTLIGRYAFEEHIGSGGMGFVVAARDPELDRVVAIKILYRADRASTVRLRREAQALARLSHPNVVAVHDVGEFNGRVFLAMEHVDGITLRQWFEESSPTRGELLTVFAAAGRGLAAAHAAGLIHRDFKPSNVMLARRTDGANELADRVRVMDFGLARESESPFDDDEERAVSDAVPSRGEDSSLLSVELTRAGALVGTPHYMAPEQFRGKDVGPPADQFAFCVALYEQLFSKAPFPGTTASERAVALTDGARATVPNPSGTPRNVVRAVLRGLQTDPERRWPSMEDLVAQLEPRRAFTWPYWAVGGVALAAGVAIVSSPKEDDPCGLAAERVREQWNDDRRRETRAAFVQSQRSFAEDAWARTETELDGWVAQWSAAARDNCTATIQQGIVSERQMDRRTICLHRQLGRLEAVMTLLGSLDGAEVSRAVDAAASLPDPSRCASLDDVAAMPDDPAQVAEIERIYAELDRCRVLGAAGRPLELDRCAHEVAVAARDTEHGPLILDARLVECDASSANGRWRETTKIAEELYFDGVEAGAGDVAREAASSLTWAHIQLRSEAEVCRRWLGHSRSANPTAAEEASMLRREALIAGYEGDPNTAVQKARHAVDVASRLENPRLLGTCLHTLGTVLNRSKEAKEAARAFGRALEVRTEVLGEVHPVVASTLNNLGTAQAGSGDPDGSLVSLQRALEIRRQLLPHEHPHIATAAANVAETLQALGRSEEAVAYYRESETVFGLTEGVASRRRGRVLVMLSTALMDVRRLGEAETALHDARQILTPQLPASHGYRREMEDAAARLDELRSDTLTAAPPKPHR